MDIVGAYEPWRHGFGCDAPPAQKDPIGHASHSSSFGSMMKVPAWQLAGSGADAPGGQELPGGHGLHCMAPGVSE